MPAILGRLRWTPGVSNVVGNNYFSQSNPAAVTHDLTVVHPTRRTCRVRVCFNANGGGYKWSGQMFGFPQVPNGTNTGAPGYGRGMLSAIRDRMHLLMYNPIQTGYHYDRGVKVRVIEQAGLVSVPQFPAPVFDDQEFEFDDKRSEFDYSSMTLNVSNLFGCAAYSHEEYWVFARNPLQIAQFTKGRPHSGPFEGMNVLDLTGRYRDISSWPGNQLPTSLDMAEVTQTIKGLRPETMFDNLWYRKGGNWQHVVLRNDTTEQDGLTDHYAVTPGRSYIVHSTGQAVNIVDDGGLDLPLFILSTGNALNAGSAVGLYIPQERMNTHQVKIIDRRNLKVRHEEDRRTRFILAVTKSMPESWKSDGFHVCVARAYLAGLLNPKTASTEYGFPAVEALTQKSIVLHGTPLEIYRGVLAHHRSLGN